MAIAHYMDVLVLLDNSGQQADFERYIQLMEQCMDDYIVLTEDKDSLHRTFALLESLNKQKNQKESSKVPALNEPPTSPEYNFMRNNGA